MRLALAFVTGLSLLSASAFAGTLAGKSFPDTVTVGDKTLVLNGMGLRLATLLKVKVYAAGLYVEEKSKDGSAILQHPGAKKIVLKFLRDVDKGDLTKAWNEGFEKNAGKDRAAAASGLNQLNGYMQDLVEGDEMSFTYVPGKGTTVAVKGKAKGTIAGEAFMRAMFSCWLGPNPPNSEIKAGLLKG